MTTLSVGQSRLPVEDALESIATALKTTGCCVVEAEPGAGKTTRVPEFLLDHVAGEIVVLEPRRLAARLAAEHVATQRGQRVGEEVGYEVRQDRAIGPKTRLSFVTEGILLRRMQAQKDLRAISLVVLDEFHERHLQSDLALALLLHLRATTRPDLQILVMSATLDGARLARFLAPSFSSAEAEVPRISSAGRRFPLTIVHANAADLPTGFDAKQIASTVHAAVTRITRDPLEGDVLIFLPGAREIRACEEKLRGISKLHGLEILPLHGELPKSAQDRAVQWTKQPKIILATNVAESSVTLPGVTTVIDTGLARVVSHDSWTGRSVLEIKKVSRASCTQRAGRAGRVQAGQVFRLFTEGDFQSRLEHDIPELLRLDLAEVLLQIHALGAQPGDLRFFDPPREASWGAAHTLLEKLGALAKPSTSLAHSLPHSLTELGVAMARLPLPPRSARVAVEGHTRGLTHDGALLGALLAEGRDVLRDSERSKHAGSGNDVLHRLDLLLEDGDPARAGLDPFIARSIYHTANQVERALNQVTLHNQPRPTRQSLDETLTICLLAGHPDRVGTRKLDDQGRLDSTRTVRLLGGSAELSTGSLAIDAPLLCAIEVSSRKNGAIARVVIEQASPIQLEWLIELFDTRIEETLSAVWNRDRERAEVSSQLVYESLVLESSKASGAAADRLASELLAEQALVAGIDRFVPEDALGLLVGRLRCVFEHAPDLGERYGLQPLDADALRELLARACRGKKSFAELRDGTLWAAIQAELGHDKLKALDQLAPTHFTLGNKALGGQRDGQRVASRADQRRIAIDYLGERPSIGSRLQDFFGQEKSPTVLLGRLPLVLHLRAPNQRDVQVTTDLEGFWIRHYPEVRRELMRRYPRHAWPIDPNGD